MYTLFIALSFACDDSDDESDDNIPQNPGDARAQDTDINAQQQDTDTNAQQQDTDTNAQQLESVIVTGPVTGGKGKIWMGTVTDLDAYGYSEKEYFFEGDANSYTSQGELAFDGKWTLTQLDKAHFKTRMMVRKPLDASKFNGTVIVEWLNVSGGTDSDPGFMFNSLEILREGYAWVGVSAQEVGVQGGGFAMIAAAPPLKKYDPERYGSLDHPGDAYSYDIFTQAAQIVLGAGDVDIMEGLEPARLVAYGESQSAGRLTSYVNGIHPLVKVFDGFFIHSRFAGSSPFGTDEMFNPDNCLIRDDLVEPVFQFETETDVSGSSDRNGFHVVRRPDTDKMRSWEVAGTAHADAYLLELNSKNFAVSESGSLDIMSLLPCGEANNGPQALVIRAAIHALNRWVTDGIAPPIGDQLQVDSNGVLSTDEFGNALGGIRTPAVDVPISTLKGRAENTANDSICGMFGETIPFTPEKLLELYPTHDDYLTKVKASAQNAREALFLLEPEEQAIVSAAEAASVPF
jgi:hypothetical protein